MSASEQKVEECEGKISDFSTCLETLSCERMISPVKPPTESGAPATPGTNLDVDAAANQTTASVTRELDTFYKGKHERKVADLKVSYKKQRMRQVEQLKAKLETAQDKVLELLTESDTMMRGTVPRIDKVQKEMERVEEVKNKLLEKDDEKNEAERRILVARVAVLEEQIWMVWGEGNNLRKELEEKIEKGELVAQLILFLTMSAEELGVRNKPLLESFER